MDVEVVGGKWTRLVFLQQSRSENQYGRMLAGAGPRRLEDERRRSFCDEMILKNDFVPAVSFSYRFFCGLGIRVTLILSAIDAFGAVVAVIFDVYVLSFRIRFRRSLTFIRSSGRGKGPLWAIEDVCVAYTSFHHLLVLFVRQRVGQSPVLDEVGSHDLPPFR